MTTRAVVLKGINALLPMLNNKEAHFKHSLSYGDRCSRMHLEKQLKNVAPQTETRAMKVR